jgi:hypothetical protein
MNNTVNQTKVTDREMVTGVFKDKESADRAIMALESHGYTKNEINVIMSDATRDRFFKGSDYNMPDVENKALKGAGAGSAIGLTLGAIIGGIAAVGSVLVPGVGIIVAGPIAAALAGAGAGSVAGGLIGALVGWGIPEAKAKKYESDIKEGKIIVGFHPRSDQDAKLVESEWAVYKEESVLA